MTKCHPTFCIVKIQLSAPVVAAMTLQIYKAKNTVQLASNDSIKKKGIYIYKYLAQSVDGVAEEPLSLARLPQKGPRTTDWMNNEMVTWNFYIQKQNFQNQSGSQLEAAITNATVTFFIGISPPFF